MSGFDTRGVANLVLKEAWQQELSLTKMQLIKLVYMIHGWSLVLFREPLVEDRPQAWKRGPVYPKLYRALSGYTSQPVNRLLEDRASGVPFAAIINDPKAKEFISDITRSYGKLHAFALSKKTHEPNTPWDITWNSKGEYAEIEQEIMTEHFEALREKRGIPLDYYSFREAV